MAVIGQTVAKADYIVKTVYMNPVKLNMAQRGRPCFNRMKKVPKLYGKQTEVPIKWANTQGISNTFANAQANVSEHTGSRWRITRKNKFGYYTLNYDVILATKNDEGAFVKEVRFAMDSLIDEMGKCFSIDLLGNGSGTLGQVGSVAGTDITLKTKDHAFRYAKNMVLVFWSAESGGSQRTTPSTSKVTKVNKNTGVVTVDAISAGVTGDDWIFRDGDRGLAANGFGAWIPTSDPSATLFNNVDRTEDITALSGFRLAGTAVDIDEGLMELCAMIRREMGPGTPDDYSIYCSPMNFVNLSIKLGQQAVRDPGGNGIWGYQYLSMATPLGTIKIVEDPTFPSDKIYVVNHALCYILHVDNLPQIFDEDGSTMLRVTDAYALEFRAAGFWDFVVEYPGAFGVLHSLA